MSEVIDLEARSRSLKTVGHISYLLHTLVAVCAVLPGVQASIGLLLVAFVIDLVKKDDALGTWQESHFSWRIRSRLMQDEKPRRIRVLEHRFSGSFF